MIQAMLATTFPQSATEVCNDSRESAASVDGPGRLGRVRGRPHLLTQWLLGIRVRWMPTAVQLSKVQELNDRAVETLIREHAARTDEPLILAVRYALDEESDIGLLEVLGGFPGSDEDEPLVTEFEPSARLRILGNLRLTLVSPEQLLAGLRRGDQELGRARGGRVVFERPGDQRAVELRRALDAVGP
jgi:hypothetical protein